MLDLLSLKHIQHTQLMSYLLLNFFSVFHFDLYQRRQRRHHWQTMNNLRCFHSFQYIYIYLNTLLFAARFFLCLNYRSYWIDGESFKVETRNTKWTVNGFHRVLFFILRGYFLKRWNSFEGPYCIKRAEDITYTSIRIRMENIYYGTNVWMCGFNYGDGLLRPL